MILPQVHLQKPCYDFSFRDEVHQNVRCKPEQINLRIVHRITLSVGAMGGVHKGQGRNQRELMTRAY